MLHSSSLHITFLTFFNVRKMFKVGKKITILAPRKWTGQYHPWKEGEYRAGFPNLEDTLESHTEL